MSRAPAKAKPPHEQDVSLAEKARTATRFSAFLFTGPGGRYRREAETFEAAVDAAIALEAEVVTTRRSLVYAIVGTYTVPIDKGIAELAGFPEEAIARFFDRA